MNTGTALLHINEPLDIHGRHDLEDRVGHLDCVIKPVFGERTPHLMIVSYDSDCTCAVMLLNEVCSQGFHGQLVGGI